MADLKEALRNNGKYLFWGGIAIAIIVATACWFLSTKSLSEQYLKSKSQINSNFDVGATIRQTAQHPNDNTIDDWNVATRNLKISVKKLWGTTYQDQQKLFKWPLDRLPKEFRDTITKFVPPDLTKLPPVELSNNVREQFNQKYIRDEFKRLVDSVDAEWFKDRVKDGGPRPVRGGQTAKNAEGTEPKLPREYKIHWNDASQSQINHSFEWNETPSTLRILYAQEDLWIYDILCRVLAGMNASAKGKHDATVWVIANMDIGAAASSNSFDNRLEKPKAAGGGFFAASSSGKSGGGDSKPKGESTSESAAADNTLQDGRYVDLDGNPIQHGELQAAPAEGKKMYRQFRMMPFRLQLIMDQRKIMSLLIELRSLKVPTEIRQVRLNTVDKGAEDARKYSLYATPVEIRGVMYLYNPVDEPLLKVEGGPANAETAPDPATKPGDDATKTPDGTPAAILDAKPGSGEPNPVVPPAATNDSGGGAPTAK